MNAGRIQDIRTRFCIRLKSADRLPKRVRMSDEITLGPCCEQDSAAGTVDRIAPSFDAIDGPGELIEWLHGIAGVVFDRKTSHAGFDAKPNVCRDTFRFVRVS